MHDQPTPPTQDVPEQMRVRLEKRERLLATGTEPYVRSVPRTHEIAELRAQYGHLEAGEETEDVAGVSGRVVHLRVAGKLCFATLHGGDGARVQAMFSLAEVGQERLAELKSDVDLGDILFVSGRVIASRRGELSIMASTWTLVSKAIRPLPNLHSELSDEARVRQRYADLIVRPEARRMVRDRAAMLRSLRATLDGHGFIEVETPMLQYVHGGAAARPFTTHLNAFDEQMTLRIALELYLKRAVVGGVDRVYEIGKTFRNEGIDSTHSAEFTMLEFYQAYGDQFTVAEITRDIVINAAEALGVGPVLTDYKGREIDLSGEWTWLPVCDAVAEKVGEEISAEESPENVARLRGLCARLGIETNPGWGAGELILEMYEQTVEDTLIQPTFVCDYPESVRPLARPHRSKPGHVEAFDLIIGGVELSPSYTELVDPVIQRARLTAQSLLAAEGDPEAMELDEDFLRALEYGCPPMGGTGLGVDRLLMLLSGASIRETIMFPLLKPEVF